MITTATKQDNGTNEPAVGSVAATHARNYRWLRDHSTLSGPHRLHGEAEA
jgi:hypothetical protein